MIPSPDIGFVYPKTGLDSDLRFETRPRFTSTGSVYLPDGSDDCVSCDGVTWTSDDPWTISFWFKSSSTTMNETNCFWASQDQASPYARYSLYFSRTDTYGITLFQEGSDGGGYTLLNLTNGSSASDTRLIDGNWHHLALVMSNSGLTATAYIDGQSWATGSMDAAPDMEEADLFTIGGDFNETGCFKGSITQFGMWNAALTQAQVRAVMGSTDYASAVTASGTTALHYWSLETDVDANAGGVDGTLRSGAVMVGDRARLPNGFDLIGNQLNAVPFSGRAIDFDGECDFLLADAYSDSSDYCSGSLWIYCTELTEGGIFCNTSDNKVATRADTFLLFMEGDGTVRIMVEDDTNEHRYTSSFDISLNTWYHIAFTIDATDAANFDVKLYIDGAVQAGTHTGGFSLATGFCIAKQYDYSYFWHGSIADVKVFNVELTAAQVLDLYQVPEQVLPAGVASSALKRWYPLSDFDIAGADSLDTLYLQDCSGNDKGALATGGIMQFSQPGIPQMGLRSSSSRCLFNDSNTVMRLSPSGTDIDCGPVNGSGAFTYLFWVQTFTANGDARLLDANGGDGPVIFIDSADAGYVRLRTKVDFGGTYHTWDTPNNVVPIAEWVHLGITFAGGDTNEVVYYVNGSPVTVTNPTGTPSGTQGADSGIKDIGGTGASQVWDGFISELAIFAGTQLDTDAVAATYNSGVQGFDLLSDFGDYDQSSNLDGWWKLDNPVTVQDLKGSTDGTWNNAPNMATVPEGTTDDLSVFGTLTQNRLGGVAMPMSIVADEDAGSSPGILSYAKGPSTSFDNTDFTVTMWVYLSNTPSNMRYFHWVPGTGYILLKLSSAGKHQCLIEGGTTNASLEVNKDVRNAWSFVAFRKDAEDDLDAFAGLVTDASLTTDTDSTIVGDFTGSAEWYLGSDNAAYRGLSGSIAMPRIWTDTALSDAQINALFNSGKRFLLGDS